MATGLYQRRRFGGDISVAAARSNNDDPSIAFGDTAAVFDSWSSADISLAVWRRKPPADIAEYLDETCLDHITGWRRQLDVATAGPMIVEAIANSRFSQPALERFLADDMALLTRIFATSSGTSRVEARLEIIDDGACQRFHVDSYPARLAVTYVGPGTVWVPRCQGAQALAEQEAYTGPAPAIAAFSVGLFAGETTGRAGLVHRSPRIAGTGRKRLFFCVNAARH